MKEGEKLVHRISIAGGIEIIVCQREHKITPFVVRGYFEPKKMAGEHFWGCDSLGTAKNVAQGMATKFMTRMVMGGFGF